MTVGFGHELQPLREGLRPDWAQRIKHDTSSGRRRWEGKRNERQNWTVQGHLRGV